MSNELGSRLHALKLSNKSLWLKDGGWSLSSRGVQSNLFDSLSDISSSSLPARKYVDWFYYSDTLECESCNGFGQVCYSCFSVLESFSECSCDTPVATQCFYCFGSGTLPSALTVNAKSVDGSLDFSFEFSGKNLSLFTVEREGFREYWLAFDEFFDRFSGGTSAQSFFVMKDGEFIPWSLLDLPYLVVANEISNDPFVSDVGFLSQEVSWAFSAKLNELASTFSCSFTGDNTLKSLDLEVWPSRCLETLASDLEVVSFGHEIHFSFQNDMIKAFVEPFGAVIVSRSFVDVFNELYFLFSY